MRPLASCQVMLYWPHSKYFHALCWCAVYCWLRQCPFSRLACHWPYSPGQLPKSFATVSMDWISWMRYQVFWYGWGKCTKHRHYLISQHEFIIFNCIADTQHLSHYIRSGLPVSCSVCIGHNGMPVCKPSGASKCQTPTMSRFHIIISCGLLCFCTFHCSRNCICICLRCEKRSWARVPPTLMPR